MPLYDFKCADCGCTFERQVALDKFDRVQKCASCGGDNTKRLISAVGFVLKGDNDWTTKAGRIRKQMAEKNRRLAAKEREQKETLPKLAPNVGGERVGSWTEAKKLAASQGKNTSSYDGYIRKEKAGEP
jgi:putative FmdB family regulatory protein